MTDDAAPDNDPNRRRRVAEHYLIGADDAARLDTTVSMAARALDFPAGQINILDDRFLYTIGDFHTGSSVVPRVETMCQFVIDDKAVIAVDDLRDEPRFQVVPGVRAGVARSYLGAPVASREAMPVGTLCLYDPNPRHIADTEIDRLVEFRDIVEDQLDLIRRNAEKPSSRELSASLANALDARQIRPWYQPVMDLATGRRVGFEALARWRRSDGSTVSPLAFVSAAEDTELVIDLDRAVIRAAVTDLARWRLRDPELRMNVNLSTRHLELADGASYLAELVAEVGLAASAVNVEITETRGLLNAGQASRTVADLQSHGFRVVLDDFGNGWSSLDWLLGLGADGVKVDRAVASALGTRVGDAVSRAVVSMTAELGITTTIEGISRPEHLEAARRHGFHFGQGYLWSTPVPARAIEATL